MPITERMIRSYFPPTDFQRGVDYYRKGRVLRYTQSFQNGRIHAQCYVQGTDLYEVELVEYSNGRLGGYCSCPRFAEMDTCKHLAAACMKLLECQDQGLGQAKSDASVSKLLRTYLAREQGPELPGEPGSVHLYPTLAPVHFEDQYPELTLRVGRDKLYVIRSLKEFLKAVENAETVRYGKGLTLCHSLDQFEPEAQALIELLQDELPPVFEKQYGSYSRKDAVKLEGGAFDRLYQFFQTHQIPVSGWGGNLRLGDGDPRILLSLTPLRGGARLTAKLPENLHFFGQGHRVLYVYGCGYLRRCSKAFQNKVYPLLSAISGDVWIAPEDLPAFCSCILSEIRDLVDLEDPEGLFQKSLPDECTPCFYFDWPDEGLTARLTFRYGEREIPSGTEARETKEIKRDVRTEQAALRALARDFPDDPPQPLEGDAAYSFLTNRMDGLRAVGEVYVTDRLRGRRVTASGARVGISVSDGLLTLDLDTGGFPPEELEDLYKSLLLKRNYYRLRDGRYLPLDGSGYETLAELTHMTQLSPKDIAKGPVTMPTFRGLYLDSVLSASEGITVTRDQQFRAMLRGFKAVAESDDTPPAHLETVLRPYQKVGFRWLKTLERCGFGGILADEMGLGKTLQVIAFFCTVPRQKTGLPNLVVCPASLILNWSDELARFAPELNVQLLMGTAKERQAQIESGGEADVWVTSYDLLKRDIEQYQGRRFYCCVLDEAQNIKNKSTLGSKAVKRLDCRQRFVLTGTPIENRLSELWNLFDFLMPGYLFSHSVFVEKLERPVVQSQDAAAASQLRRLVQPFLLRRLKQDVLKELPPKVEYVRRIALSKTERKTYHATAAAARSSLEQGDQGKLAILAALTRLRQICCDPNLCFENYEGETSKLDACLELCAGMTENGHQVLLFSQFPTMLERIRQGLDRLQISSFTLQGSTPKEKRAQLVRDFNSGGAQVFLISLKAGGTGLNLTAADVVIHYDPWWNQAAQNQATDRAHRIGQRASVQVYKLIAKDTIEEKILELQSRKAALMDAISGDSEEGILSMSKEDLLALLEI